MLYKMVAILTILAAIIHDGVPRKDGILENKKYQPKDLIAVAEDNSCGSDNMLLPNANGGDGEKDGDH
jgi:hypothetical protein